MLKPVHFKIPKKVLFINIFIILGVTCVPMRAGTTILCDVTECVTQEENHTNVSTVPIPVSKPYHLKPI